MMIIAKYWNRRAEKQSNLVFPEETEKDHEYISR
jgi:hypothetical protein